MPARTTPFADSYRMRAFRALERVLRDDPALAGGVKTWASGDGSGVDRMPTAPGMLPYLGLTPQVKTNETMGESRIVANLEVRVDVAVAGLIDEDIVNFWDAIEDALVKGKPYRESNVMCFLKEHGVMTYRVIEPGFDAFKSEHNPPTTFLAGSGRIALRITRPY